MGKIRNKLSDVAKSEQLARKAVMEWAQGCFEKLEPTGDPDKILKIVEAMSKLTNAQMKVRQVKGREEDDNDDDKKDKTTAGLGDLMKEIGGKE